MINKDRIVPITRTDLLSFFAAIFNTTAEMPINILQVADGAVELPEGANGVYLAAEPLKTLPVLGQGVTLYFVPAYDFEMTMTPMDDAPEFVPNPGNICAMNSRLVIQADTGARYTVA